MPRRNASSKGGLYFLNSLLVLTIVVLIGVISGLFLRHWLMPNLRIPTLIPPASPVQRDAPPDPSELGRSEAYRRFPTPTSANAYTISTGQLVQTGTGLAVATGTRLVPLFPDTSTQVLVQQEWGLQPVTTTVDTVLRSCVALRCPVYAVVHPQTLHVSAMVVAFTTPTPTATRGPEIPPGYPTRNR